MSRPTIRQYAIWKELRPVGKIRALAWEAVHLRVPEFFDNARRPKRWWHERIDRKIEERLDDYVADWHDGAGMGLKLHEFLGMTWGEYAHWTQTGEIPPRTYAALRKDVW